jgi:DNA-binding IclR family transcriptional regulator
MLPVVRPLLGWWHVADAVADELARLVARTGFSAKVSLRQGGDQVTIARQEAPAPMSVVGRIGSRYPVVEGASGAALLSEVDEAELEVVISAAPADAWKWQSPDDLRRRIAACRAEGLCDNLGAHPQGIDTVSAAVHLAGRHTLAVTLIGLRGDFDPATLGACREALLDAARGFGRRIAALPPDAATPAENRP